MANLMYRPAANARPPKTFVPTEHTLMVHSSQREDQQTTPSNDIRVRLNPANVLSVQKIECASVELPNSQYVVPSDAHFVRISEGLHTHGGDVALQHMTVETNGGANAFTVWLPFYTNVVTTATPVDATTIDWTTAQPHGLALNTLWDWGEAIRLIGSPVLHNALAALMPSNTSFSVQSPTVFRLTNLPAALVAAIGPVGVGQAGDWGHVFAPPIPSPRMLAERLTRGFAIAGESSIRVRYDEQAARYQIEAPSQLGAVLTEPPLTSGASVTTNFRPERGCVNPSTGSVAFEIDPLTGVPYDSGAPAKAERFRCQSTVPSRLVGKQAHHQAYVARTKPGHHDAATLADDLNFQFQRYWFDPAPCAGTGSCPPASPSEFCFVDADGQAHAIVITPGKYVPQTLAAHVEALMDATSAAYDYSVAFDASSHRFTIAETNGHAFSLEFQCGDPYDPTGVMTIAARLGFEPIAYRGCSSYTSPRAHHGDGTALRYGDSEFHDADWIYTIVPRQEERTYHISAAKRSPIPDVALSYAAGAGVGGTGGVLTVTGTVAHGHRVGAVVHLTEMVNPADPTTWRQHLFRVATVASAFRYECADVGAFLLAGPAALGIDRGPYRYAHFNVHNVRPQDSYPIIPPKTLGLRRWEYLSTGDSCHRWLDSDHSYDHTPPMYVLLELVDNEHLSSRMFSEATGAGTASRVLAKVQLFPAFKLERLWPVFMDSASGKRIQNLRLRLLNPDLTPFDTRGLEWSCTLVLTTLEPPTQGSGGV